MRALGTPRGRAEGIVLPRRLRKPARLAARLLFREPPRFAATLMSAAYLIAAVSYGTLLGGHMPGVVQAVTARTGFAIEEVRINGNVETSEIDIFQTIGLDGWTSLIGFSAAEAREKIATLPWVETVSVRKVYPSVLEVDIVEKDAFAIWQHGSKLALIEKDGTVVAPMTGSRHAGLPLVIGFGADEHAAGIIGEIARYPQLAERVRGYIRISDRRWNLRLANGITVKLPERGAAQALADIVALDREHALFSRDIESVDLRLADRLVVRLSEEAAEAREAALKERLGKDYKPRERRI